MLAAWWLRLKGYRILGQRVRCARGEIDLVARRGRTVAFVEVKRRADRTSAAWAVEERALRRVVAAAGMLAPRYARPDADIRIDAILIVKGRFPRRREERRGGEGCVRACTSRGSTAHRKKNK